MCELNQKVKKALIKIDFVRRYEELSEKYNYTKSAEEDRLEYIDRDEVKEIISDLGYIPRYNTRERFYKIKDEKIGDFKFRVHIILRYGIVELIWVAYEKDELLTGEPWAVYVGRLVDLDYMVLPPVLTSYEDLDDILKVTFEMYEDFKRAITENE